MKKITVGLIGWNGKFNIGDDAMTFVIINYFRKSFGEHTSFIFLDDHDMLPSFGLNIEGIKHLEKIRSIPKFRGIYSSLIGGKALSKCDYLIFGGGSIFHTYANTKLYVQLLKKFRKSSKNGIAGAISVSVGPFSDNKSKGIAIDFMNSLDFAVVRDHKSYETLLANNVSTRFEKAIDIAVLLPTYCEVIKKKSDSDIVIGLSVRSGHHEVNELKYIAESLNQLYSSQQFNKLRLFAFCEYRKANDMHEINQLLSLLSSDLKVEIIGYNRNTADFCKSISGMDLMLATRLHAGILSYALDVPSVMLSYHEKCEEFAKMAGIRDEFVLPVNALGVSDLVKTIEKALGLKGKNYYKIPIENSQKDALRHFGYI